MRFRAYMDFLNEDIKINGKDPEEEEKKIREKVKNKRDANDSHPFHNYLDNLNYN